MISDTSGHPKRRAKDDSAFDGARHQDRRAIQATRHRDRMQPSMLRWAAVCDLAPNREHIVARSLLPTSSYVRRSRPRSARTLLDRRASCRPTSPLICAAAPHHRGLCSLELNITTTARARRAARESLCDRSPPTSSCVRRSRRRSAHGLLGRRASCRPTAPRLCACCTSPSPRLLTRAQHNDDGECSPSRE